MRLEPVDRVHDATGEPDEIDLVGRDAARLAHLAREVVPVERLHRAHEPRVVDALHVHDLGFHRPLERVGERVDRLRGLPAVGLEIGRDRHRRTERREHVAAERVPRLEGEADRDHGEPPRVLVLELERDPRRAGLDALHARFRVCRAFGIDRDELAGGERVGDSGERLDVLVHLRRVVLPPVDRNDAHRAQEAAEQRVPEERRRREVVNLARHGGTDHERVDEVVRMVDAEQDGARPRHALGMAHARAPEEEPEPEAREAAHERVAAVHARHAHRL